MFLKEEKLKREFKRPNRWDTSKTVSYTRTSTVYHFKCDECGVEFTRPKNGKMHPSSIHLCKKCNTPEKKQELSVQTRHQQSKTRGKKFDRGYKEIYVGPDYPYRNSLWVREHIVVMEQHIGKRIPKGMVVHHIDGDKLNNNLDNLLLCTIEEHNKCHAANEQIVFDLYKKGFVKFDKNKKEYYLGEFSA